VSSDYRAVFCDIWGVIHNGKQHFPDAYEALKRFKRDYGPVILISNSPRPRDSVQLQLSGLGIDNDGYSAIITSGDATRIYLQKLAPLGPALMIGDPRENSLYDGLGLDLTATAENAAFISCTSPYNDDTDKPEDYIELLKPCAARGLTMVCANPDKVVQKGDRIIYCAGSIADVYESLGGKVIMAGKPYAPIYELCYQALAELGCDAQSDEILAIGDGLPTDVLGANAQNLDLIFIAAGIHALEATNERGILDPLRLQAMLDHEGAKAKYVAPALSW